MWYDNKLLFMGKREKKRRKGNESTWKNQFTSYINHKHLEWTNSLSDMWKL